MAEAISFDANEAAKGQVVEYAQPVVSEDYLAGAKAGTANGEGKNPFLRYPVVDKDGNVTKVAEPQRHDDWNTGFHDTRYKIHRHNEALKDAADKDAAANAFDPLADIKTESMIVQDNNKSDSLEGDPKVEPIKKSEK